jgi:mono/diheme cytochrome c family protein
VTAGTGSCDHGHCFAEARHRGWDAEYNGSDGAGFGSPFCDAGGPYEKMDEKLNRSWGLLPVMAVACLAFAGFGQQEQTAPKTDEQFTPLIRSVEGPNLFRAYCAPCHGMDGKGSGPAAPALKVKPPDLTLLARNNRGQFPRVHIRQVIAGDQSVTAHGSGEMPVWGPVFHQVEEDVDRGNLRLENLVNYLESLQAVGPLFLSGAELYRTHCASCHGNDLKGKAPAFPPDLTTLAQRQGGKFPDAYVVDVMRSRVLLPAHGPSEMPVWGADFRSSERLNEPEVTLRITNLVNYIKSLQAK